MSKPYLSVVQQIRNLKDVKGLIINNESFAEEVLTDIGYFSLIGGYKSSFINPMTRKYDLPTTFEDILALYEFDEVLRELTFSFLTKIEQKIQQLISDSFCSSYGEKQQYYLTANTYSSAKKHAAQIVKLISILDGIANKNTDHDYLVHYRKAYNNVPLWATTHAMTFGQISNMYSLLQSKEQSKVSKVYPRITEKDLEQYLSALTLFRNTCAHEERLFNFHLRKRSFPDTILHKKMGIPKKGNQYIMGKTDYFGLVIAFRYLLREKEFLTFKKKLKNLIDTYCSKNHRISRNDLLIQMGFPANWEKITRYSM